MTEFQVFLCDGYIRPYVARCTGDAADLAAFSALDWGLPPDLKDDLDRALRFHALHGFLLGLRTGRGLADP